MRQRIGIVAEAVPVEDRPGCGYWHTHLPVARTFIDSGATPRSVRRECIQCVVDAAAALRTAQRARNIECRVVAMISLPELFDSQVIVFFGSEYWSTFFTRDTPEEQWVRLALGRSLMREWVLRLPEGCGVQGFEESINEVEYQYRGELWFVGDLA